MVRVLEHKYKCDDQCPNFKSINLCSHIECNGDLVEFVNWPRKEVMQIATHDGWT